MIQLILMIGAFLMLSGLLAMIDAAVLSITPAEVEELIQKKVWGAKRLKKLQSQLTRAIIVVVIFTNITNVSGPILIGQHAAQVFQNDFIGILTALLTLGTIIFSEIIPKSLGTHYSPYIAPMAAPVLRFFMRLLFPLVWCLERIVRLFKSGERIIGTERQIRALVDIGGGSGHIEADETHLIHQVFALNDRTAKDIMAPASKMVTISDTATVREAADAVFKHSYSRYPLFHGTKNHIESFVLSREILQALAEGKDHEPARSYARDILKVPATVSADNLLLLFRRKQIHLAVVHEKKKVVGLITLEDVLEELVGDIEDEGDSSGTEQ
jgi:CBS domain containing-hemolysin-like protein